MNCKPGDLAIVVKSMCGNEGKVVECKRLLGAVEFADGEVRVSWELTQKLPVGRHRHNIFPDAWLRPIRPSDGTDETLIWAGKPEGVTA